MKIAIVQFICCPGMVEENLARIKGFTEAASLKGCEVVVFPEMSDTGYDMGTILQTASPWPGRPIASIQESASSSNIAIICGLSERDGSNIYNSVAVIDNKGNILHKYRKTHLFPFNPVFEDKYLKPGDAIGSIAINDITWGILICYDLRFPEACRKLLYNGAEAIVVCSAWPVARVNHWQTLTRARAIENQAYIIGANRAGSDAGLEFAGKSCIIDPYGETLAEADTESESLITAEISREEITRIRQELPVSLSLRPDIYLIK